MLPLISRSLRRSNRQRRQSPEILRARLAHCPASPRRSLDRTHSCAQPWPRERVLMPLKRPCRRDRGTARSGGYLPLEPGGFHRPLSDPSTDLQVRCHGSERDGRNVPLPDVGHLTAEPRGRPHHEFLSDSIAVLYARRAVVDELGPPLRLACGQHVRQSTSQVCAAPTVSAILAPRLPIGFGCPVVLSRTV
jgi:hypothetical protein